MEARFGAYAFNTSTRELRCGDQPVRLSPKAFDLLAALIQRRPLALSKTELHAALWPDTFVSDGNLAVLVAEVRRALGDTARQPLFVRTINRFGYSFVGALTDVADVQPRGRRTDYILVWGTERVRLAVGENVIGRDPAAQICVEAVGVSRRHASIVIDGNNAQVRDLSSKNGTFVDGVRITTPTTLDGHAELRLGALSMCFRRVTSVPTQTV